MQMKNNSQQEQTEIQVLRKTPKNIKNAGA